MAFTVLNAIDTKVPQPPFYLSGLIHVFATCKIDTHLIKLFENVFYAIDRQLDCEKRLYHVQLTPVTCIVSDNDVFSVKLSDTTLAATGAIACYCISKWQHFDDQHICTFIAEELYHHFWAIINELDVNFKVIEVLRHIYPNIKISDVYSIQEMREEAIRLKRTDIDFDSLC